MDFLWFFVKCSWWILPAAAANTAPLLAKNSFKFLAKPVDFNLSLLGRSVLGKNKTWRGLITGTVAGMLIFSLQQWLYQFSIFEKISLIDYYKVSFFYGFLLAFGSLLGDLTKSFLKRRVGIPPGKTWFPFDEIDWTIGALILSTVMLPLPWLVWLIIIISGMAMHLFGNFAAITLGIKDSY